MEDFNKPSYRNLKSFENLCGKIACLTFPRTNEEIKVLNQLLDDLISLDYNLFCVKKERGTLLINRCCYLISPDQVLLASKAINLFTILKIRGNVIVEGETLPLAVKWSSMCLEYGDKINILKCLQSFVKGNGAKIKELDHQILSDIKKTSNNFMFTRGSEEVSLNCLRYSVAVTYPSESKEEILDISSINKYFEIFLEVLMRPRVYCDQNEILFCKYIITAMRGIGNLIEMSNELIFNNLGNLLGIVKEYMCYGLFGKENYEIQKLLPTSATIPEVLLPTHSQVKKLRGKYDKKSKKVNVSSINSVEEVIENDIPNKYVGYSENNESEYLSLAYKTSDSDFSDNEASQNSKIKSYESKVRQCALILLGIIVQKGDSKIFVMYMPSFLPDALQFYSTRNLITILLNDPYPKCRCEVLGVLISIITNCRLYFLKADSISKSAFTTFSCTVSNIIEKLHTCLILTLKAEQHNTVIKRILKCISDLIRCTPYHKLNSGLIVNIASSVYNFLSHQDVNIQILALTVFGCIVSIEPKVNEVKTVILLKHENQKLTSKSEDCQVVDAGIDCLNIYEEDDNDIVDEKSWLFDLCFKNLMSKNKFNDTTNVALQIESLQVIGALMRNFFMETVSGFSNDVIDLLKHCLSKNEYSMRLYSGKLMETLFNSLQFSFCNEDESKRPSVALATKIWESLLPGPVTQLIQSEEPMLRCTGCDCLANIGISTPNSNIKTVQNSLIFDQLPRDKEIICITQLFGCVRDESPAVRSSASRAMAIFVLFPSLRCDSLFFLDAIDTTIVAANDQQSTVRTQASWLFGNLSESIVLNKKNYIDDGVSLSTLSECLKIGIKLAGDFPKIKPGAVRGIGNLLQIVDDEFMKKFKELVIEGLDILIKNATSGTFMKARWNSCYAIGNLLQNPIIHNNPEWMSKIISVMASLVQNYKNFKVRISAGFVLGVPPTRESYGDMYNSVWSAVLNALENSKNISDFNEYQHRDQLVDQLCLVMCHLISIINPTDLNSLQDVLYFHLDNLSHFMTRFRERIIPEKSNILLKAADRIHFFIPQNCLTVEDKNLLRILYNLFVCDN